MSNRKTNIVVIILDTLRAADVGCYGSAIVRTPHLDRLSARGTRFTRAYPESLPTIPVRRALASGRRAFPFRDYHHCKWGTVCLPGWQPLAEDESTLAEDLAAAGYQTGFACTTQHVWNPGFNFQRGFWQWEFVRGYSGEDRWQSAFGVPLDALRRYGDPATLLEDPHAGNSAPMVLANRGLRMVDAETATARLFQWSARFLADNRTVPFYLLIDSFAPHEPWEAPEEFYRLYADPNYTGLTHLAPHYGPATGYTEAEVADMQAHYRGLVTHTDHWLGLFLDTLDTLGLADNTAVLVVSDHGTNFCENPRRVIGKPADSMYPGVMQLVMIVALPGAPAAGAVSRELVYNLDVTATVYDIAGVTPSQPIAGQSLLPLCGGRGTWRRREFVTCRYANSVCYIDDTTWALGDTDGRMQEVFDLERDPHCRAPLPEDAAAARWSHAWERLLRDAGGEFPDYRGTSVTDALGRAGDAVEKREMGREIGDR